MNKREWVFDNGYEIIKFILNNDGTYNEFYFSCFSCEWRFRDNVCKETFLKAKSQALRVFIEENKIKAMKEV